jgi:hypothetical protein
MPKTAQAVPIAAPLAADVLTAAASRPKLPPFQGEGSDARTMVPAAAIQRPKLPPLQGD